MGKSIITEKYQCLAPLYEEVTHIPLLMYIPKAKSKRIKSLFRYQILLPQSLTWSGQNMISEWMEYPFCLRINI
ncbi:MAG: hypothetical protein ACP5JO_05585 [Candidatus Ratteibacteria bacterium]